jgi:hypothetical protein
MQREWASVPGVRPADVQIGARSRCMCAATRSWSAATRFRRCSGVALWRCSGVALWRCSGVALWRCSGVALWRCSGVAQPRTTNTTDAKVADFHVLITIPFGCCDRASVRLLAATRQLLTVARQYRGVSRSPSFHDLPQQLLCRRSGKFSRFAKNKAPAGRPRL